MLSPEISSKGPGCLCGTRMLLRKPCGAWRNPVLGIWAPSPVPALRFLSYATWLGRGEGHSSPLTHCFLGDKTKMPKSPSTRTSVRAQGQPGLTGKPKWFLVFQDDFLAHLHFKIVTDLEN